MPVMPQRSAAQSAGDAAALIPAVTPRSRTPQTPPPPAPPQEHPPSGVTRSGATTLRRLSAASASPRRPAARLAKLSCPPQATGDGAAAPPAGRGSIGGAYSAASPVPLPADVRSTLLQRVSAAGTLQRQSAPFAPHAGIPSLQRPSVPCLPYSSAAPAAGGAGTGVATAALGYGSRGSSVELQRASVGPGLARSSVHRRMSMMADVMLGTDFLERSAQTSAPHGGTPPPPPPPPLLPFAIPLPVSGPMASAHACDEPAGRILQQRSRHGVHLACTLYSAAQLA